MKPIRFFQPQGLGCGAFAATLLASMLLPNPCQASEFARDAYIKASNTDSADRFGGRVAVSGNTMVVGAIGEDCIYFETGSDQGNWALGQNSGAAYVFVRDPATGEWTQQAYLKATNTAAGENFGHSVAISGDTIVIGNPADDSSAQYIDGPEHNTDAPNCGAAYVFERNPANGRWLQTTYLKSSNSEAGDYFGYSVAISGDYIAVGAPYEDSSAVNVNGDQDNNDIMNAGAAYVFRRSGSSWRQVAYLKASNPGEFDDFGYSIAISNQTVVVGAWHEDGSSAGVNGPDNDDAHDAGALYVFAREIDPPFVLWRSQGYLKASDAPEVIAFGAHVDIDDNTLVARGALSRFRGSNAVYTFERSGRTWSQRHVITWPEMLFTGASVGISGDTLVVGAQGEGSEEAGLVHIFRRDPLAWTHCVSLPGNIIGYHDHLGSSVAVDGRIVVAGAPDEDSNATGINGDEANNDAGGSGAVYAYIDPIPEIHITNFHALNTSLLVIDFTSAPGIPDEDWKFMGSCDLLDFNVNHTGTTLVSELTPGNYQALVNTGGRQPPWFVRIEREG